jgi:hypothetical protein
MGHSMIYDGSVTGVGASRAVPLPFAADSGPNRRFDADGHAWSIARRLVDDRHLSLLHLAARPRVVGDGCHPADDGQPGYSYAQARDTHLRLGQRR